MTAESAEDMRIFNGIVAVDPMLLRRCERQTVAELPQRMSGDHGLIMLCYQRCSDVVSASIASVGEQVPLEETVKRRMIQSIADS